MKCCCYRVATTCSVVVAVDDAVVVGEREHVSGCYCANIGKSKHTTVEDASQQWQQQNHRIQPRWCCSMPGAQPTASQFATLSFSH